MPQEIYIEQGVEWLECLNCSQNWTMRWDSAVELQNECEANGDCFRCASTRIIKLR